MKSRANESSPSSTGGRSKLSSIETSSSALLSNDEEEEAVGNLNSPLMIFDLNSAASFVFDLNYRYNKNMNKPKIQYVSLIFEN